ncbi:hypothetical protein COO91_04531 [Nostoc flagelliforme CCNUN1]|uniref:Uncharacterized protein n=1 Tax=Nostoc flagelliforme CCNUN1 TaxID=2038116 RepID=A0A2K8SSZ7_9NOSO|nr:hypothetical protein COO91_04531 [Nostoc flagelliforme CCNUN1]
MVLLTIDKKSGAILQRWKSAILSHLDKHSKIKRDGVNDYY